MNANPILFSLPRLREAIEQAQTTYDQSFEKLNEARQAYDEQLALYIYESKMLKNVTWKIYMDESINLLEVEWKIDIKAELRDLVRDTGNPDVIFLQLGSQDEAFYDEDAITLWLPLEDSDPPRILINKLEYLEPFLSKYELEVDLSDLEKAIQGKQAEVVTLESIKKSVPIL